MGADKITRAFFPYCSKTDVTFSMLPIKGTKAFCLHCRNKTIGLVFYIKKLGGIEPNAWPVRNLETGQIMRQGFSLHPPGIPDLFYIFADRKSTRLNSS